MLKPIKLANKNFLSSLDTSSEEIFHILEIAKNFKNKNLNIQEVKRIVKKTIEEEFNFDFISK